MLCVRRKGLVADVPIGEHRQVAMGPSPSPNSPPGCWNKSFESLPVYQKRRGHSLSFFGTPEGTRTPNPRNRNPMLYPLSHRRVCFTAWIL